MDKSFQKKTKEACGTQVASIVLAAGRGNRMKSELPKVLHSLDGDTLIHHVVSSLSIAGVDDVVVVVGYRGEEVVDSLGDTVRYAWQNEQLGTGHAVLQAEDALRDFSGPVIVACGDVPLIKASTFSMLIDDLKQDSVKAVVLSMKLDDPFGYGRIVKDDQMNFIRIVEEKDATDQERLIDEVNSGTYAFDKNFLFEGLKKVTCDNAQGEYYLPDALNYILNSGYLIKTRLLDNPIEGSGVNSTEDLVRLENYLSQNRIG